jgi:hypothetical protein
MFLILSAPIVGPLTEVNFHLFSNLMEMNNSICRS